MVQFGFIIFAREKALEFVRAIELVQAEIG
jgi:hypothetical protein